MIETCRYCGYKVVINGPNYECVNCKASVGVRIKNGLLADKELRLLRVKCHQLFDAQWVFGKVTRSQAYINNGNKHFGQMDKEECLSWLNENGHAVK